MSKSVVLSTEPRTPSNGEAAALSLSALSPADLRHVVLDQYGYRCAFCGNANRRQLRIDRIVPESYGGPEEVWNLWALCRKCARLRHRMKGSRPEPGNPEGLQRLLTFPHLRNEVLDILKDAAERAIEEGYDSLVASQHISRRIDGLVGWYLERRTKPDEISPEDWEWLCSCAAWDAAYWSAEGLLPADGRGGVWTRCPWGAKTEAL